MNYDIEAKAAAFAADAHRHQFRKYTGEPYIVHPCAVAQLVRTVEHTPAMLAAAWLHDVVEDCGVPLSLIRNGFGLEVETLVGWLTDVSRPGDGNRATRKAIDRAYMSDAPAAAQTIKLADLIHNTSSIVKHDKEFARVYLPEKAALLAVLMDGSYTLFRQARLALWRAWGETFNAVGEPLNPSLHHPKDMIALRAGGPGAGIRA